MIYVINSCLILLVVMIHYETLSCLSRRLSAATIASRLRVLLGIFGALCAHVVEIWLFAFAYFVMNGSGFGELEGAYNGSLMDSAYFSFTAYSSLGTGDIFPTGDLRFVAGIEALVGLVLIAWTASFLYLKMSRYWPEE